MVETYYDLLGVARDASTDEVVAAYRERLKETHPDVNDAADASSQTRRLIEARDVLTDPVERERYDELGHDGYIARRDGPAGVAGDDRDAGHRSDSRPSEHEGERTSPGGDASRGRAGDARAGDARDGDARGGDRGSGWGEDVGERTDRRRERTARRTEYFGNRGDRTDRGTGQTESGRNRTDRKGWQTGAADMDGASWGETGRADRQRQGGSYATGGESWRSWDSDRSYAVSSDQGGFLSTGEIPDSGTLITLLAIFLVYPVLLWGAMTPAFPLVVNASMVGFAVIIVAFLQSVPTAAVTIFGFWSVVLPMGLLGVGVDPVSLVGLGVVLGVVLPLGFSLLVRSVVRF